jgi:hypothetical protein
VRIAWREYLLRPDADFNAPGAPRISRAQAAGELPALRAELEQLRAKRRRVDARYDPRRAVFAQTRYLLGLYRRFPSLDWVFQAYHGGENGVRRTLRFYLGPRWPGSAALAIRQGGAGGRPLRFEDLYFGTTPRARAAAFSYLYGRSDDHRYYWWKLRAAEQALARYRADPNGFNRYWEGLLPGRGKAALWYPDEERHAFPDLAALQTAHTRGRLVAVSARPGAFVVRVPPLAPADAARWHQALRPEAKGALLLVAAAYKRAGGGGVLSVGILR